MGFLSELLFQLLAEIIGELLLRGLHKSGLTTHPAFQRGVNYLILALLGITCGVISLLFFPAHFIANPSLRLVNLIATPVVLGALMTLGGDKLNWPDLRRHERFIGAFLVAFGVAFTRYVYVN